MENKYQVDWQTAMSRIPLNFRYQAITGHATGEELAAHDLRPGDVNEFERARIGAGNRIRDYLLSEESRAEDVARVTSCPKALLSHMKAGRRVFCAPTRSWELLAYDFMHISVTDLCFGENRPITLPPKYGIPATLMMTELTAGAQKRMARIAEAEYAAYEREAPAESGHHRPMAVLLRERLVDAREEYGYTKYQSFGPETPNCLKSAMTMFWYSEDGHLPEPKLNFFWYAALSYPKLNLDWFTAEDPLRGYEKVYALSVDGETMPLNEPTTRFMRHLLRVDDAHKQKLLTLLWGQLHTSICEKYE